MPQISAKIRSAGNVEFLGVSSDSGGVKIRSGRMDTGGWVKRTEKLGLLLEKGLAGHHPSPQQLPLLAYPRLHRRLRRAHDPPARSARHLRKSIPAAAMIAEPAVGMENGLPALLALPYQFGSAPDTKMLTLVRQRVVTALRTDSIFVRWHRCNYAARS
jgi:hypothetical protein